MLCLVHHDIESKQQLKNHKIIEMTVMTNHQAQHALDESAQVSNSVPREKVLDRPAQVWLCLSMKNHVRRS